MVAGTPQSDLKPGPIYVIIFARRYKRHIVPLLSLSVDFYVRVFVRVFTSAAAVKDAPCRLAYVWQSSGCDSFWLQVGKRTQEDEARALEHQNPSLCLAA